MIALKKAKIRTLVLYVGRPLLFMIAWDFLIVCGYMVMHWEWLGSNYVPLALYGTAISIIVGFRNNYAYGRWWEARTLWGAIVNRSRTFGRQVMNTLSPRAEGGAPEGWGGSAEAGLLPDRVRSRAAAAVARAGSGG